jgi:hypothetical protein
MSLVMRLSDSSSSIVGLAAQEQGVHSPDVPGDEAERLLVE